LNSKRKKKSCLKLNCCFIKKLLKDIKKMNPLIITIKEFMYLLMKCYLTCNHSNSSTLLFFKNRYILFGDKDKLNNLNFCGSVFMFEIYDDGNITVPNYNFNKIKEMKMWNIKELIKHENLIINKI
jgi:hypothetical protein